MTGAVANRRVVNGGMADCAVVGAGPSGLLTALLLARAGLRVRVLERAAQLTPPPGGVVLQPATLGLLDRLGLLAGLRPTGTPILGVEELHGGEVTFAAAYSALPDVTMPHALAVPLREVRARLLAAVTAHPAVTVELGAAVTAIAQHPTHCAVSTAAGTASARFAVGADGKYSTVRAVAGFEAEVRPFPRRQLIARLPRPDGWPSLVRSHREDPPFVAIPSSSTHLHLFGDIDVPESHPPEPGAPSLGAAVTELASAIAPTAPELADLLVTAGEPIALVRHHTVAVTPWVRARVTLIGDSAHSVHPYGGQGINLGLQDAALLAQVITSGASPTEFEYLRRPFVARFQDRQRVLLGAVPGGSSLYRATFADLALGQSELRPLLRDPCSTGLAPKSPYR